MCVTAPEAVHQLGENAHLLGSVDVHYRGPPVLEVCGCKAWLKNTSIFRHVRHLFFVILLSKTCHIWPAGNVLRSGSKHTIVRVNLVGAYWTEKRSNQRTIRAPSIWYEVLGTKSLVRTTWYQILGTKYLNTGGQVLGTKYFVPSTWYQIPATKCLVLSTWYQVPNISCQVFGTKYLVPRPWYQA